MLYVVSIYLSRPTHIYPICEFHLQKQNGSEEEKGLRIFHDVRLLSYDVTNMAIFLYFFYLHYLPSLDLRVIVWFVRIHRYF